MKITWKVDDGFVGHGEHVTEVPDEWLEGLEDELRDMEIEEIVSNDFSQLVSFEVVRVEKD